MRAAQFRHPDRRRRIRCRNRAGCRALLARGVRTRLPSWRVPDSVDDACLVVADKEITAAVYRKAGRPPQIPAIAKPSGEKILVSRGLAVRKCDVDDLISGGGRAIPRAVECDKRPSSILFGKLRTVIKHDAERCGMRWE